MLYAAFLLARTCGWSRAAPPALHALQERRLRALVAHAYARVPVHRRRLEAAGLAPGAVRTLADLPRIPTMPKRLLREAPLEELVVRGFDPARGDLVRTSGSTGTPLRIVRGPREVDWHRAAGLRVLRELGFRWTDRTLEIRALAGPTLAVQRFRLAPKLWASILDPPGALLRTLLEYRPQVLCATPSTLHELAATALAEGVRPAPLRLVISDAEPLVPTTRALVARAFGTDPTDVYGLVELSNFAFECHEHRGLHLTADTHVVEVLDDDGRPAAPGAPGRVVVTDLIARTMPMLRYETGDRAGLVTGRCPCGRTSPRLVELVGRAADVVVLPDGRRLHWPYFHETLARFDDLERYQVIQDDPHRLRVRVLTRPERWGALTARLRTELATQLPASMTLALEPWGAEPEDPTRKYRPVLSRLDRA